MVSLMKKSSLVAAAVAVVVSGSSALAVVQATSQTHLTTYEDILYPNDSVNSYHTFYSDSGTGVLQKNYPSSVYTSQNVSAYVDPATHIMRAVAESNTFFENIAAPGGSGTPPHMDRTRAGAAVDYRHDLIVGAGSTGLHFGDPVQVKVSFHLDGNLILGGMQYNAGNIDQRADMNAHFLVRDPQITGDQEGSPNPEMVSFSASAWRERYVTVPGQVNAPIDGATWLNHQYKWNLGSNASAVGQSFYEADYQQLPYNWDVNGGTTIPPVLVKTFDTGNLVATFDTYVGANLEVIANLGLDCYSYSNFHSPSARADFGNTFALDFEPTSEFAGLQLISTAAVPEPGCLSVLAAAALVVGRRRSR